MIKIIPAILPKSLDQLSKELGFVAGHAPEVQIDVVDGRLAPNTTWPYTEEESFEPILSGEEGLPHWDAFDFEFDVMAHNPSHDAERYIQAGASRVIIHMEADGAHQALQTLQSYREGEFKVSLGLGISAGASASAVEPFRALIDGVQVMGIAKIGFQGQPFEESSLELIRSLRAQYPDLPVQVDGGVTMRTIRALVEAGATRLIAGSSIFGAEDPATAYKVLVEKANEH